MKNIKEGWERRFDKEFPNLRYYTTDGLAPCEDEVKGFIRTLLVSETKRARENEANKVSNFLCTALGLTHEIFMEQYKKSLEKEGK
jgi:hypothetical protein